MKQLAGILMAMMTCSAALGAPGELLVLGSGASEGMPGLYCVCDFCVKARSAGGKNIRMRTAFALGETIRIDWGPDALAQTLKFQLEPWKLRHVFITHSHEDHLFPMDFWVRGVSQLPEGSVLNLYGNEQVIDAVSRMIGGNWAKFKINPVAVTPGQTLKLEPEGVTVKVLAANHTSPEQSLMYCFDGGDYKLLVTGDTDVFPEPTMQALAGEGISAMMIDATWMMSDRHESHLGVPNIARIAEAMHRNGALRPDALIVPVHLAPGEGAMLHDEFTQAVAPLGMTPAWDGMRIKLNDNTIGNE